MFTLHQPNDWAPACAVFDCDGVLLDSEKLWGQVQAQMFAHYQLDLTPQLEASLVGVSAGDLADRIANLSPLKSSHPGGPSAFRDSIYQQVTSTEFEIISQGVQAIDGALELVKLLSSKIPVAVASNSGRDLLTKKLTSFGFDQHLETWVSFHDVPAGKPAPDIYLEAVRRLGYTPDQALTFEDSITGMKAATGAGTHCLIYRPQPGPSQLEKAGIGWTSSFTDPAFLAQVDRWLGQ